MSSDTVFVYVKTSGDDGGALAGRLDFADGNIDFRYAKSWIEGAHSFAFHPDLLPLGTSVYSAKTMEGALSIFKDAGPGVWGREVIKRLHGQIGLADSLVLSNNLLRIGVFRYSKERGKLFESSSVSDMEINEIYAAISAMENHEYLNESQSRLLDQGSSMDGMRPKAFVDMDGASWILKFPSKNDYDNKSVNEMIGMELARACGIETPEVKLVALNHGKQGLAVKRFDLDDKKYRPLMSVASAMGFAADETFKLDYRYVAQTISRMSGKFQADRISLFKRMALNVMISNRDDHAFNQAMIMEDGRWQLSPVYDVVCGEGNKRDHSMVIGDLGAVGSLSNVLSSSASFGLDTSEAKNIIDDMIDLITLRWRQIATEKNVSDLDINQIEWAILHDDIFRGYDRRQQDKLPGSCEKPRTFRKMLDKSSSRPRLK